MAKKTSKKTQPEKTAKKSAPKSEPLGTVEEHPRVVKEAKYKSFSLQKKLTPVQVGPTLPTALQLTRRALGVIKRNWKLFGVLVLWYGIINIIFIQGLGSSDTVTSAKATFDSAFTGSFGHVLSGLASLSTLVSTSGQSSDSSSGSYQFIWIMIVSLAFIWALREVYAKNKIRARDAFYQGMYPLIPVALVLGMIAIQMIPFVLGGTIFSAVISNGIATTWIEASIWGLLFLLLAILSIYFISSSIFALYIACLPGTKPMVALRSARQLVANRRWRVIRKILFLPLLIIVLNAIIMLPFLMFVPVAALWIFYILTMINFAIIHSYYYALYRSLL